jgi:hypothetical protein
LILVFIFIWLDPAGFYEAHFQYVPVEGAGSGFRLEAVLAQIARQVSIIVAMVQIIMVFNEDLIDSP